MKHMLICREYPPAPGGGIGTYAFGIAHILAQSGETVHVIGQLCKGAEKETEEECDGRLIIHRVLYEDWEPRQHGRNSGVRTTEERALIQSDFPAQCFSWTAALLAENIIEQEGIDIIEAQEYEAPLYYLQLRCALGLGPKRRPPCMVHLHSPIEFIARYNDCDIFHPYFVTEKRLEEYSIAAADGLLCPSRFLAGQTEAHYRLKKDGIRIIPYPLGAGSLLERDRKTWEDGTICYVGRLERRKGAIEWIDAAVSVAPDYPKACFEFIGGNGLGNDRTSADAFVESRIPRDLRHQFLFRGAQSHSAVSSFLAGARMSVVPSRWDNFPYACMEAMCSGLPVIATREGGMAEMITDGQTGWLADDAGPEGLAVSLRQALQTSPARVEEMGRKASEAIRLLCDNKKILESQMDFRSMLVRDGATRSVHLPVNLPWAGTPFSDEPSRRFPENGRPKGVAIVVTCLNDGRSLDKCLESLKQPISKPAGVVVVDAGSDDRETLEALDRAQKAGWRIVRTRLKGSGPAKNAGIEEILDSGLSLLGFAFLGAQDRMQTGFVDACAAVLERCPDVGLVSCWARSTDAAGGVWTAPCPSFPYQWVANDAGSYSVIRTEALREAGGFRSVMDYGYEDWDLANAVMAAGWKAVTLPEVLIDHPLGEDPSRPITDAHGSGGMAREMLERFPEFVARDARDIGFMAQSLLRRELLGRRKHLGALRTLPQHIREAARQVLQKMVNAFRKN